MNYVALHIPVRDALQAEILTAELAEYPFESFETDAGMLKAYIPEEQLAGCKTDAEAVLARYGVAGRYELIESEDWNALWERGFSPVDVAGRLLIRAPYHDRAPQGVTEVVLLPRMAFGSGHHATTWLMSCALLDMPLCGLSGLDMGSGTGVLSVVAVQCGAAHMDAVDIDEWAERNCRENIALNGVEGSITPLLGDVGCIAGRQYDFVLANINRNVLTAHMPAYAAALRAGGDLLMSGFLEADLPLVVAAAAAQGMHPVATKSREGWMLLHVRKA